MSRNMLIRNIPVKHDIPDGRLHAARVMRKFHVMNLEKIRTERGLTQDDLAEMSGLKQSTISKIERGYDGVTLRTLHRIAEVLQVEIIDLLGSDRTSSEALILQAFRELPVERQQGWLDMAQAISHQKT